MRLRPSVVLGLLVAGACSQFDVRAARDPSVDVSRFRSWAWLPPALQAPADQTLPDRYLDRKLREAAERELAAKGYVPTGGDPDFFLNYRLTTNDRSSPQPPYRYGLGWWGHEEARSRDTYDVGTLLLDAIDARTSSLVWRGSASARLLPHASLEKSARRTQDVVEHILKEFPPRSGATGAQ